MYWSRSFLLFLVEQQISGGAGGDVSRRIVCLCALSVRCLCRLYVNNNRNKRREGNKKKMTRSEECKAVMWPQEHTVQSYWPLYLNTLNGLSIRGKGREKKRRKKRRFGDRLTQRENCELLGDKCVPVGQCKSEYK